MLSSSDVMEPKESPGLRETQKEEKIISFMILYCLRPSRAANDPVPILFKPNQVSKAENDPVR